MNNYIPFNYDAISTYQGLYNPTTVHSTNNAETAFFERCLYQRAVSVFEWTIPDSWDLDYLQFILAFCGYCLVVDTPEYGVIPQWGSLQGTGIYYQPTTAQVHTNLLNLDDLTIGKDCALIKFTPDYFGIWDIIHHYSEKLALASSSIDMNLLNSRLAYFIGAKNKAAAESIKKMLDHVNNGNPNAVFDTTILPPQAGSEPFWEYHRDVKGSYVGDILLDDYRTILNDFDTEIGIPSANITKRERLVTDEVNANNIETVSRSTVWLETMQSGIKQANSLFSDINISVKFRFNQKGGDSNVNEIDTNRNE